MASEILYAVANEADGIRAEVVAYRDGFAVSILDIDSGNYLSGCRDGAAAIKSFATIQAASAYADSCVS
jgi:hypothetical protein